MKLTKMGFYRREWEGTSRSAPHARAAYMMNIFSRKAGGYIIIARDLNV